jgi:hypothetical protein
LEFAYTLYTESLCDACGRPFHECRNDKNNGLYEIAATTCHAQAAVDAHTSQKGFKPEPGQRFYAVEIDEDLIDRLPLTAAGAPRLHESVDDQADADDSGEL